MTNEQLTINNEQLTMNNEEEEQKNAPFALYKADAANVVFYFQSVACNDTSPKRYILLFFLISNTFRIATPPPLNPLPPFGPPQWGGKQGGDFQNKASKKYANNLEVLFCW